VALGRAGLRADEALPALTATPARLAGLFPRKGSLQPGADADVLIWNGAWELEEVYRHGMRV
ncbi:MAG: amidohydrolase family protein, partial [Candidatus Sumerlaeota bacterium]|nr:amidohydrolase family protein [Candidatus Sumerlaeota bacterium]